VVALAEDPVMGITIVLPHHYEIARAAGRHLRGVLPSRGVGVDVELAAQGRPRAVVALAEDAARIEEGLLAVAPPHHHEVAGAVRGHRGLELVIPRICIDVELAAQWRTGAVVALAEDAIATLVLPQALPHHHEVARAVHGHGR